MNCLTRCFFRNKPPLPKTEETTPIENKIAQIAQTAIPIDARGREITPPNPSSEEPCLERKTRNRSSVQELPQLPEEEETTPLLCGNPMQNSSFLLGLSASFERSPSFQQESKPAAPKPAEGQGLFPMEE